MRRAVVDGVAVDVDGRRAGEVGQEGGQVGRLEAALRVHRRGLRGPVVASAQRDGHDRLRVSAARRAPDKDRRRVVVLDRQRVVVVVVVVVVDAKPVDVQLQRRRLS